MSTANKRVTIDFPSEIYRMIKAFSAFNDSSVKDFVLKAVRQELNRNHINIPNNQTSQTMQKTDLGKDLEEHENFSNFLIALSQDMEK